MGFDQGEWWDSGMGICFVLLAYGTALNVLSYKLGEARPPELSSDELVSLEISRVLSGFVVVA